MSIHLTPVDQYPQQLSDKLTRTQREFADFHIDNIEVFESPPSAFRMRAEFKIWHEDDRAHYAMYQPGEYKKPFIIEQFEPGSPTIQRLMPVLISEINQDEQLKIKLFQMEFLTSTKGDSIVTLIYHKPLNNEWLSKAKEIAEKYSVHLIGRSRKQKEVIGQDYIFETFEVDGFNYKYQQIESSFTQPNAFICQKMLNWAKAKTQGIGGDLLELYCGNGNFTLPLSRNFRRVIATEISKVSIQSATLNCSMNQVENIQFLRMSSEEFTQAYNGEREFRRLKNIVLSEYQISSVFVDPPRAGLDEGTRALVAQFENIIYVSCNPETLKRDLEYLNKSHEVTAMALFDQFPYTDHRESGVVLKAK